MKLNTMRTSEKTKLWTGRRVVLPEVKIRRAVSVNGTRVRSVRLSGLRLSSDSFGYPKGGPKTAYRSNALICPGTQSVYHLCFWQL